MSDQTTLSSFEDSIAQINQNANTTTNTTPPIGEYSITQPNNIQNKLSDVVKINGNTTNNINPNISNSILANSVGMNDNDFDSLPNVFTSLNLDENLLFSPSLKNIASINNDPSTPPSDWKLLNTSWTNQNNSTFSGFNPVNNENQNQQHILSSNSSTNDDTLDNINVNSSFANNNNNNNTNRDVSAATNTIATIASATTTRATPASTTIANPANNTGISNDNNGSFILPDSYLFDPSITNTPPSSILSPNKNNMNKTFTTPILGETSRRLNYNLTSPNNQNDEINSSTDLSIGEPLGMGIIPNNAIFGNYIPNQFNGFPNSLNLLPNLNINQQQFYQPNLLNQNYNLLNNTNNNNNNNNVINNSDNTKGIQNNDISNKLNDKNNKNLDNNNNRFNNNNHHQHNRNNLSLNSTANIHRKHTSNNKRGEDASRFINASLNDFVNEIYYLCKDQHGCRFLQKQLEINGEIAATKIFNEIQLNVIELMIDPFGNYLIQKLLERVNENQRTTLVRNASNQFVRIALDPHGTRALQKLVECISTEPEYQIIINSLSSYVVLLSRDLNGNHVIQKCLQKLPTNYCNFIFDASCDNCVKIAKHRHGCCVLQRCFDHGTPLQCERLSLKVGENCAELSIDPYGNYVVQYVLSMEENRLRIQNDPQSINKIPDTSKSIELIIKALAENLSQLSTHKFGSNVIEKSLRIPTLAPVLINQLLKSSESLKLLLHDAYGNYVLQTSLDVADDSSFKNLSEMLKPFLNDVRNTPHGRRILSKLISRSGNSSIFNSTNANNQSLNDFELENSFQINNSNHQQSNHQHNNNTNHSSNNPGNCNMNRRHNNHYNSNHNNGHNNNHNHNNNNHNYNNSSYNSHGRANYNNMNERSGYSMKAMNQQSDNKYSNY